MKQLILAMFAMFFSAAVWAGGTAVIGSGNAGEQATLEYDGGKIRLSAEHQGRDGYLVVDGNNAYAVSLENGQPTVLDLAAMGKMIGVLGGAAGQSPLQLEHGMGEVQAVNPLGRAEVVAGITGQLYELVYLDEEGARQTGEAVLSTDPRALELTRALLQLSRVMAAVFDQPADPLDALGRSLLDEGLGLLRIGNEMRLLSLDAQTPAAGRFALPAEPGSMPDLGALMKEAARQVPEAVEALGNIMEALEGLEKR